MRPEASDYLDEFLAPVGAWFRDRFENPTLPQRMAWPEIAAGRNCLLVAPTGSGKTLAAFLACLDRLWRQPPERAGVRVLYISPLKALNEDIARNLREPLDGICATAEKMGTSLRALSVAVRTGDTPAGERQKMLRRPPELLITTPESLHLLLTSRGRETLRTVTHVLVDEIHAVAPNKRGVFLAVLLERLQAQLRHELVRVGLSATQRPLEEVARFLGGRHRTATGEYEPRPVTILDAGQRKELDLEVSFPAAGRVEASVWPAIEARLQTLIQEHRSTIVFANNRRVAERLTSRLNESMDDVDEADADTIRSHHGSLSLDRRRSTEQALKDGELKAVVATASLELGIDMGAVELVCQVESPGSVARGLQRVGRAGHLVGRTSKGRMLAKTASDLLESAALARAMRSAKVEALRVPTNCLDVLAQQVVACAAMDDWEAPALLAMLRQAYPYRGLTAAAFESVLEMVSGRFALESFRDLRPRLSWDRIHNRLRSLPGTAQLALVGGGTIPDNGNFPVHLGSNGPRLGELDEEFVLERRVGETFVLGSSAWNIEAIEAQRVVVSAATGRPALMPFWRGEGAHRTSELGEAVGQLCRELDDRRDDPAAAAALLERDYDLDARAAQALVDYVARQRRVAGAVPDDQTIVVETFRDPAGELGLAVLTPWGGRVHHALKLALVGSLRRRLGVTLTALHGDDGVLFRLPSRDEPLGNVFRDLTPENVEATIREELGTSALFGLRFRQNAGRALLLPRPDPSKRTPLWLQRIRARDLLQAVRQFADFPIVVETYRECLDDDLDLPRLSALLEGVQAGSIRVVERHGEIASPFTSSLVFEFTLKNLYEWDDPKVAPNRASGQEASAALLDPMLATAGGDAWLDPAAVALINDRLRGTSRPPRTVDEMAEWLRRNGDLTTDEIAGPMQGFLVSLEAQGRAVRIELAGTSDASRWISAEDAELYQAAFLAPGTDLARRGEVVGRYFRTRALVGREDLVSRYGLDRIEAEEWLTRFVADGAAVRVDGDTWADRQNLAQARRLTIAQRRREVMAVAPETWAALVQRLQNVHPATRREGQDALEEVLDRLKGVQATAESWERDILPARLRDYRPAWLDDAIASGVWTWRARGAVEPLVAFQRREGAPLQVAGNDQVDDPSAARVLDALTRRGALYVDEISRESGLEPLAVRQALVALNGAGLVTNDRFEPLRVQARGRIDALQQASAARAAGRRSAGLRRASWSRPDGRWSRVMDGDFDPAERNRAWVGALLDRYGVVCREVAELETCGPSWRELFAELEQAELRGEVRRGYLVEGLSGVQFAWPETVDDLGGLVQRSDRGASDLVLLSSLDPANLYGSGAPLDVPLLEGGTTRMLRNASTDLVFAGGRPVLIIEGHGKRLTGLGSASEAELQAATELMASRIGRGRRTIRVESYNLAPVNGSPAAPWLRAAGFVADDAGMVLYQATL